MSISITCPNGHRLKANENLAGRSLLCPTCKASVLVPRPEEQATSPLEPMEQIELGGKPVSFPAAYSNRSSAASAAIAPGQHQPLHPSIHRPAQKAGTTAEDENKTDHRKLYTLVFLGGAGGGGILAVLVLLVVWMLSGSGDRTGQAIAKVDSGPPASTADRSPQPRVPSGVDRSSGSGENIEDITEKLHRIGLAFLNFHDHHRYFYLPRARDQEVIEPNRLPRPTELSWRVHLLPYLEQKPLYDQFHLDEPWDSEHNKTLLDKMPEVYRIGSSADANTRFQVITGPGTVFDNAKPTRFADLSDGLRHTILALVVGPDRAAPWTKPDELSIDTSAPLSSLGTLPDGLVMCVMADGKPLILRDSIEPDKFMALTTAKGNEIIDAELYRRQWEEQSLGSVGDELSGIARRLLSSAKRPQGAKTSSAPVPASSPSARSATPNDAVQMRAIRDERARKLKEIVLGMQEFHDFHRQFPPGKDSKFYDSEGKPLLSWRVHLLQHLQQEPLSKQFKLNEPWDSPHNRQLLTNMPDVFRDPLDAPGGTTTRFVTLTGPQTPFSKQAGPKISEFRDGTSTTLLIVAVGADKAVPWTAPQDSPFNPAAPFNCLGSIEGDQIFYARVDGAVKILRRNVPSDLFKAIVTPAGGEPLPQEFESFIVQ